MNDLEKLPPPHDPARLPAWAAELGVEELLDSPVSELAAFLSYGYTRTRLQIAPPTATIRAVVVASSPNRVALTGAAMRELLAATTSYLAFHAERRHEGSRRSGLWAVPPERPEAARLSRRLLLLLEQLRGHPRVWAPVYLGHATAALYELPPAVTTTFSRTGGGISYSPGFGCTIFLDPGPEDEVRWECGCQRGAWAPVFCSHLRAATEWLLDVLHDPSHELHSGLEELIGLPAWSARLRALSRAVPAAGAAARPPANERLVWLLHQGSTGTAVGIGTNIQKRTAKGAWTRGRFVGLASVSSGKPFVAEEDRGAVERLEYLVATGRLAGRLGEVIEALAGHPRVVTGAVPQIPVKVRRDAVRLALTATGSGTLALVVSFGGRMLAGAELRRAMSGGSHLALLDESAGICHVGRVPDELAATLDVLAAFPVENVPRAALDAVLSVAARLAEHVELELDPAIGGEAILLDPVPSIRLAPLAAGGLEARIVVRPRGPAAALEPGEGPRTVLRNDGEKVTQLVRDLAGEVRAAEPLAAALAPLASRKGRWSFEAAGEEEALDMLLAVRDLGEGVPVEWPEDAVPMRVGRATRSALKVRVSRKGHLFGIDGEVEVDGERVPLAALLAAARRGARYVALGPGRFARIERELRERLAAVSRIASGDGHGSLALGALAATRLPELLGTGIDLDGDDAFAGLLARVASTAATEPALPEGLTATLRPYQADGFRWLSRLARWRAGAVLADDMGLGKTLQALALLLERRAEGPALVIAPTSVCTSWLLEASRFAPGLEVIRYRGAGRERALDRLGPGVVMVASYDVLALDIERLAEIHFATLVLDEAQAVKNPMTRRARAARRVAADVAVALSGTPLENHLGELWSIFRVVSPGLLGSWEHFRERFAAPIEREGDRAALADLVTTIRPFLLRRTKAEVAPELPPRTEVVRWVVLSHLHREIYEAARRETLEGLASGAGEGERFAILAAITRLRLLACHPRLVDPASDVRSAKLAAAISLVEGIVETGQRALVFSQFTSHLALLREELDRRGMSYLYLDGSTPVEARDRAVKAWRDGQEALFLLSLKAGGQGLNLMGADSVLHLDPWWNPAVEDQATDRTHRIGQERPVTVVRLITSDTIEEAVLALHEAKRDLARGVLEGAGAAAAASTAELVALIRSGDREISSEIDEEADEAVAEAEEVAELVETRRRAPGGGLLSETVVDRPAPGRGAHLAAARPFPDNQDVEPPSPLGAIEIDDVVREFVKSISLEADAKLVASGTARTYGRAATRFLEFVVSRTTAGAAAVTLPEWVADYLKALRGGAFPAPRFELPVARAALRRLCAQASARRV